MNEYYLRSAYDLRLAPPEGLPKGESLPKPPEITAAVESSKFHPLLSEDGSGDLILTTPAELEEFISELNKLAGLYRKHLSQETFNSSQYRAGINRLNEFRKVDFYVKRGLPDLGVKENINIYVLEKDMFIFGFVEEKKDLKVLTLFLE